MASIGGRASNRRPRLDIGKHVGPGGAKRQAQIRWQVVEEPRQEQASTSS